MSKIERWRNGMVGLATACALIACGGGGTSSAPVAAPSTLPQEVGAPALSNNISTDGLNWINYRRSQAGMPVLAHNSVIDKAAQGHSDYQKLNNVVTHDQTPGLPGFTGAHLLQRLNNAGYSFGSATYAYGEVISATTNNSGFFMAEELITAIYHRFVMFEPKFKEAGTGAATNASGYTYFTSDFAANNGYGPGLGRSVLVSWPFNGQTGVQANFFSDYESPDPVAGANEVGYPVSVHADIDVVLGVSSFTIAPRGGALLAVKLLAKASDAETPASAAAIVPLAVLKAGTTYDVNFSGTADGAAISKSWSFTTK
ncbi:MAG: CAP domain-containing protein [Pseudomonadota bacterium]